VKTMNGRGLKASVSILFMSGALIASLCTIRGNAQTRVEEGKIDQAAFRIDVPKNWNGMLVIYCHGYEAGPVAFGDREPLNPALNLLLVQGYAVAQSGFSVGGWAVKEAIQDTEALREYFIKHYRKPKETYVVGISLGGFLTLALMEKFQGIYDGGLALCGPLAPANWFLGRRVFDFRVVFDHYFPSVFPPLATIPTDYRPAPDITQQIEKLLEASPEKAAALARLSDTHTNSEIASNAIFFTYILMDLQRHANGNPFDNRDILYEAQPDDKSINDEVKRYVADRPSAAYLVKYYTPDGALRHPLLAIRTTYDPLIPAWVANKYLSIVEASGSEDLFAQQYVEREGHCAITDTEIARALSELVSWRHTGNRPQPGKLPN
jgi:pimeloyl-ACP methyl ester carboxylesterase